MKKRRMRLLALFAALTVTVSSIPVSAAETVGQMPATEYAADTEGETGYISDVLEENTENSMNGEPSGVKAISNETVVDVNYTTEERTDSGHQMIFRKYTDSSDKATFQSKWIFDYTAKTWAYYTGDSDETAVKTEPEAVFESEGKKQYSIGKIKIGDVIMNLDYYLTGEAGADKTAAGNFWIKTADQKVQYLYCWDEVFIAKQAAYKDNAALLNGSIAPSGLMEGIQKISQSGKESLYLLDKDGYAAVDKWNLTESSGKKYLYYFGADGKQDIAKIGVQTAAEGSQYFVNGDFTVVINSWKILDNAKAFYFGADGKRDVSKIKFQTIENANYWIKDDGTILKADWETDGNKYFYFGADGKQDAAKVGLQDIKGSKYFLQNDSTILKNDTTVVEGIRYYFDAEGKCTKFYKVYEEGWKKNSSGWWYQKEDGTWLANEWKLIDGSWYVFDSSGYMRTGWFKENGNWYYLTGSGAMAQGWVNVGSWYYMTPGSGAMKIGWYQVDGNWYYSHASGQMASGWVNAGAWYYLNFDGTMAQGWVKVANTWYYLTPGSGVMQSGDWLKLGDTWYYLTGGGAMATGWQHVNGNWYYFYGNGAMATGWINAGAWYYLNESGAMLTGWQKINGSWYFLNGNGAMAHNRWVGDYYVGSSGAMLIDTFIDGFFVGLDGKWIPGYGTVNANTLGSWEQSGGNWYFKNQYGTYLKNQYIAYNKYWYYLNADGIMERGWYYYNGYKLYADESGRLIQDISNMVSGPYVIRVNRTANQVTILAKDGSNGYVIPVKSMTCSVGLPSTPTPTGTYYIQSHHRWSELMGPSWGQWTSHVVRGIFIHSVAGSNMTQNNLSSGDYNMLGQAASHGCIRLCVRDAKWIYDNCRVGTQVTIGDDYYEPLDKPATIKLSYGVNLKDPTDVW